jgi:hypothetical protein
MSFLVSDQIQNMQLELNILNQAMDDNDFILFLNRTNEYFGTNYKMPTSERQSDFLMFNGVNEYPLPEDFAGIIEPKRPYGNLSPTFQHQTTKSFVHWPYGYATSFKFDRENQYLVANMPDGTRATLNACDSLTENGTWAASDGASGLFLDNQIYTEGTGSLNFTITAGVDAILTCTGMSAAVDATDYLNQGWIFLDIDCPNSNTTALTSITLRIGSDASNYYEMIATTRYRGDTILNNWGLVGFNMATKTTVGSPDVTGIDYIRVAIAGAETGTYRLDNIFLANAVYFQLPYYSQYNIKADDGTYKAQITAIGDTVSMSKWCRIYGCIYL